MKWLALLAGGSLVVALLVIFLRPADEAPVVAGLPISTRPVPAAPVQDPPRLPAGPGIAGIVKLQGVMYRGKDGAQSQALLSVNGQAEQMYRSGEAVVDGWSVHQISPQQVVLAKEGVLARLELLTQPSRVAQGAGASVAPPQLAASTQLLPGFAPGPPPVFSVGTPEERNRNFVQAMQGRTTTAP